MHPVVDRRDSNSKTNEKEINIKLFLYLCDVYLIVISNVNEQGLNNFTVKNHQTLTLKETLSVLWRAKYSCFIVTTLPP